MFRAAGNTSKKIKNQLIRLI